MWDCERGKLYVIERFRGTSIICLLVASCFQRCRTSLWPSSPSINYSTITPVRQMQQPSPGPSSPIYQYHPQLLSPDQTKPRPDDCKILFYFPANLQFIGLPDVYFERSTVEFSSDTVARSTAAKLKLESYYKVAVDSAIERNAR